MRRLLKICVMYLSFYSFYFSCYFFYFSFSIFSSLFSFSSISPFILSTFSLSILSIVFLIFLSFSYCIPISLPTSLSKFLIISFGFTLLICWWKKFAFYIGLQISWFESAPKRCINHYSWIILVLRIRNTHWRFFTSSAKTKSKKSWNYGVVPVSVMKIYYLMKICHLFCFAEILLSFLL